MEMAEEFKTFSLNGSKIGDTILNDIYAKNNDGIKLVATNGASYSQELIEKLKTYTTLLIKEDDYLEINKENLKVLIRQNKDNTSNSLEVLYKISDLFFDKFLISSEDKIELDCAKSIVASTILLLKYNDKFLQEAMSLFTKEHTLSTHSLQVCIYSLKLGLLLHLNDEELIILGLAAFLHDVGYKKLTFNPISKKNILTQNELKELHAHPIFSIEILYKNGIKEPLILNAVKNHHERYDGSGYPHKLTKEKIDKLSAIIAICDTFEAMTSHRNYKKKIATFEALRIMLQDGLFNQSYLRVAITSLK